MTKFAGMIRADMKRDGADFPSIVVFFSKRLPFIAVGCVLLSFRTKECGHSARCLLLPDGETLALDAWGHLAVETGDVRHLSPSTVTSVAIVHLRTDGPALVKGMRDVRTHTAHPAIFRQHTHILKRRLQGL